MATNMKFTQTYAANTSAVRSMIIDSEYIKARALATGALAVHHTITAEPSGNVTLIITRTLPSEMPTYAAAFVGETLTITETQVWQPEFLGQCFGNFSVTFSAPLTFIGTASITTDGDNTVITTEGELKASIPFMAGKVEHLAKEQTQRYLRKEQEFALTWLREH
jgi:Protein of unknown function (DUF2505)